MWLCHGYVSTAVICAWKVKVSVFCGILAALLPLLRAQKHEQSLLIFLIDNNGGADPVGSFSEWIFLTFQIPKTLKSLIAGVHSTSH